MDYLTTNCEQKIVGIHCSEILPIVERLPRYRAASRRIKQTDALENILLHTGLVLGLGCFFAALIALGILLNPLMPVSPPPAPMATPATPATPATLATPATPPAAAPAVARQDSKVSSMSIPILGEQVPSIKVSSPDAMITQLKEFGLWELDGEGSPGVPPVVFTNFPNRLSEMSVDAKKKIFLHSLLPVALVAMAEVKQERTDLQVILKKLGDPKSIVFSEEQPAWQERLTDEEKLFIQTITEKYRTQKATVLLDRINVLPISLVLAQGAFESFWGTSRFAREGNNLFGMWTWGEEGIVPLRRDPGKTHKLVIYDSLLDAVRHFVLTINRLPAYKHLWQIRKKTMNSLKIADGLYYYSERHNAYIKDVKRIIRVNRLARFDRYALEDSVNPLPASTAPTRLAAL